jgi:hypothetical protein
MKLISEYVDLPVETLVESDASSGKKKYFIEGIFMQADAKNRNGRIYERKILERAVDDFVNNQVKRNRAVGELDHPDSPQINLDKVSHRILNLEWKGSDVIGKALVLDTPCGQILKGLLDGGVQLGVSSRGMGSLRRNEGVDYVSDDFILNTVDVVQDPSAHHAFVNGIMEGVEWFVDNGVYRARKSNDTIETEPREIVEARTLRSLEKFLSSL